MLGKIGLRSRQCSREIGNRLALSGVKAGIDLKGQDIPRPTMLDRGLGIPEAGCGIFHFLKKNNMMPLWQARHGQGQGAGSDLSHGLCDVFASRLSHGPCDDSRMIQPSQVKGSHAVNIGSREARNARKGLL